MQIHSGLWNEMEIVVLLYLLVGIWFLFCLCFVIWLSVVGSQTKKKTKTLGKDTKHNANSTFQNIFIDILKR